MLILVMGANSSGKSAFAEALIPRYQGERFYIATMLPHGEEGTARVNKHRVQRATLGCTTFELPHGVGCASVSADSVVLLEDASNLLANGMFEANKSIEDVFADIQTLYNRCAKLIVVTISGLDTGAYGGETRAYIEALNALNSKLYDEADAVVELHEGQPLIHKGVLHAFA